MSAYFKLKKAIADGSFEDVYHFEVTTTDELDRLNEINSHYATYAGSNPGQYIVEEVHGPLDGVSIEKSPLKSKRPKKTASGE
ncbi:hypothetical protein [Bosea sp. TAF32]|uniref:hypothetical protein n=1 Tax=Bosea sp. TAF32 TaxID=3237482 RepID=UPI003F8E12A1